MDLSLDDGLQLRESMLTIKTGPTPRVFITVTNTTSKDIKIPGRTFLGDVHLVRSATPMEVKFKEFPDCSTDGTNSAVLPDRVKEQDEKKAENNFSCKDLQCTANSNFHSSEVIHENSTPKQSILLVDANGVSPTEENFNLEELSSFEDKLDKVDFTQLNESQKLVAKRMFIEERDVFAKDDNDIGSEPELKMEINTHDNVPVQKTYNSIPRPLYEEVKNHIQDLINRGYVVRSKSSWSSPVVIVRKKSGDMRLCCNFRALNQRTVPDRHPLPRIQETLVNLGGSVV